MQCFKASPGSNAPWILPGKKGRPCRVATMFVRWRKPTDKPCGLEPYVREDGRIHRGCKRLVQFSLQCFMTFHCSYCLSFSKSFFMTFSLQFEPRPSMFDLVNPTSGLYGKRRTEELSCVWARWDLNPEPSGGAPSIGIRRRARQGKVWISADRQGKGLRFLRLCFNDCSL